MIVMKSDILSGMAVMKIYILCLVCSISLILPEDINFFNTSIWSSLHVHIDELKQAVTLPERSEEVLQIDRYRQRIEDTIQSLQNKQKNWWDVQLLQFYYDMKGTPEKDRAQFLIFQMKQYYDSQEQNFKKAPEWFQDHIFGRFLDFMRDEQVLSEFSTYEELDAVLDNMCFLAVNVKTLAEAQNEKVLAKRYQPFKDKQALLDYLQQ